MTQNILSFTGVNFQIVIPLDSSSYELRFLNIIVANVFIVPFERLLETVFIRAILLFVV